MVDCFSRLVTATRETGTPRLVCVRSMEYDCVSQWIEERATVRDMLKAMFDDEERQAAAVLGESADLSLKEKVAELFEELPDPLLSADDVAELLGSGTTTTACAQVLDDLRAEGYLESDDKTQRALDPADIVLYRKADVPFLRLVLTATESRIAEDESRFQLTCNGRLIRSIARIDRLDAIQGTGQQRAEIKRHVQAIAEGIKAGTPIPNPVLLVLLEEKTYVDEEDAEDDEGAPESFAVIRPLQEWLEVDDPTTATPDDVAQRMRLVEIDIPFRHAAFDQEKCALLVDGQQRTAALAMVPVEERPIVDLSVALMVEDAPSAGKVFTVANTTQKIATDFSRALLATMPDAPDYLKDEQTIAGACRILALGDPSSPFNDIVKYPGVKAKPTHVVAYNTLFHVVTAFDNASLVSGNDPDQLAELVRRAYTTVRETWPGAWGLRVTAETRLMHGASLRALASVLILKAQEKRAGRELLSDEVWEEVRETISGLVPRVAWTTEDAHSGTQTARTTFERRITEVQNTSQDIQKLGKFLMAEANRADEEARQAVA
jgi:DGQHR domain-containing protein